MVKGKEGVRKNKHIIKKINTPSSKSPPSDKSSDAHSDTDSIKMASNQL